MNQDNSNSDFPETVPVPPSTNMEGKRFQTEAHSMEVGSLGSVLVVACAVSWVM